MSEQTNSTINKTLIEIPLRICLGNAAGSTSSGTTSNGIWESGWFDIAASSGHYFAHKLMLPNPATCTPMLVARVKTAAAGWEVGDILFVNGCNLNGSSERQELGSLITLSDIDAYVGFGNSSAFSCTKKTGGYGVISKVHVECKLVLHY